MSEEKKKIADDVMKEIEKRLNENKDLAEGWGGAVHLVFTDIQIGYRMKFDIDGTVHIEKKPASEIKEEDADATAWCEVQVMKDILDKKVNAMEVMGSGKFKTQGKLAAFMKLNPAIM